MRFFSGLPAVHYQWRDTPSSEKIDSAMLEALRLTIAYPVFDVVSGHIHCADTVDRPLHTLSQPVPLYLEDCDSRRYRYRFALSQTFR